jgi:hypothetical protein
VANIRAYLSNHNWLQVWARYMCFLWVSADYMDTYRQVERPDWATKAEAWSI